VKVAKRSSVAVSLFYKRKTHAGLLHDEPVSFVYLHTVRETQNAKLILRPRKTGDLPIYQTMKRHVAGITIWRTSIVAPNRYSTKEVQYATTATEGLGESQNVISIAILEALTESADSASLLGDPSIRVWLEWSFHGSPNITHNTSHELSRDANVGVSLESTYFLQQSPERPLDSYGGSQWQGRTVSSSRENQYGESHHGAARAGRAQAHTAYTGSLCDTPSSESYSTPQETSDASSSYYQVDHVSNRYHKPRPRDVPAPNGARHGIDYDWADPNSNDPPVEWSQIEAYRSYHDKEAYNFWQWDQAAQRWKHESADSKTIIWCPREEELD
jgi:hypothetical protein